tara:strand:+ start:1911 stop:2099 length:189 start_codon:yes stop_codon:yes gene_type:complete
MKINQEHIDNEEDILNKPEKLSLNLGNVDNLNYLYPNGHRMMLQMRWFKGSRDRGLKSNLAA